MIIGHVVILLFWVSNITKYFDKPFKSLKIQSNISEKNEHRTVELNLQIQLYLFFAIIIKTIKRKQQQKVT